MQPSNSTIQFKDVLSCLNRFGVDPNILARQNWQRRNAGVCDNLHNRDVVIFRLVSLITACARSVMELVSRPFIDLSNPGLVAFEEEKFLIFPLR